MNVGDLVRFYTIPLKHHLGCLPPAEDTRWTCGLVQEVCGNGNVSVLWPEQGLELVDKRFLEVISEEV